MKHLLLSLVLGAAACSAATTVEVTAKFADVPAGTVVPAKPESLGTTKGVNVLSAPKVTTSPGQLATIEVNQDVTAPDGSVFPLGVTLTIKPTLTEKGGIAFSGKATDRFKQGQRESESLSLMTFVAREFAFKGVAASGSTVLLNGAPAASAPPKKDAGTLTKARELVIYLTFKKVDPDEAPKKPVTKPSTTKPSPKKAPAPVKKPSSPKASSSSPKKKK